MRISDWSSDVCSSDLLGRRRGFLLPRRQRRGGGALDAAKTLFVERAAEAADDHPANELRIATAHFGLGGVDVDVDFARRQIGIAACRERVCQYVSISVVAVSIKNKNTQKQRNT